MPSATARLPSYDVGTFLLFENTLAKRTTVETAMPSTGRILAESNPMKGFCRYHTKDLLEGRDVSRHQSIEDFAWQMLHVFDVAGDPVDDLTYVDGQFRKASKMPLVKLMWCVWVGVVVCVCVKRLTSSLWGNPCKALGSSCANAR